jgi:hypothetical protein
MPLNAAVELPESDRAELARWLRARSMPAGLAQRARIVLLAADGVGTSEIVTRTGVSKPTVIAWKKRYAAEGIGGPARHHHAVRRAGSGHRQGHRRLLPPPPAPGVPEVPQAGRPGRIRGSNCTSSAPTTPRINTPTSGPGWRRTPGSPLHFTPTSGVLAEHGRDLSSASSPARPSAAAPPPASRT